ncbi:MAG: hypothetical protein DRP78_03225 [Candidatus Omnitrophota bacterium]|nr:MAG: hypothetical protein DRP78_03225 [Candidatus Omnitrophota bacterium]
MRKQYYFLNSLIVIVFSVFLLGAYLQSPQEEKDNFNQHFEFDFKLTRINKKVDVYLNYYYKLESIDYFVDFKVELLDPNGRVYRNKITNKHKYSEGLKKMIRNAHLKLFTIGPEYGKYKLTIDVINSNFKLKNSGIQLEWHN